MFATAKGEIERAFELDPADPEIIRVRSGYLSNSAEKIAALEKYLALASNADPEDVTGVRDSISFFREKGDRKLCTLSSPHENAVIPLQGVSEDAKNNWAFGLKVLFNGKKSVKLVLDTGASGVTLKRSLAQTLGVRMAGSVNVRGVGDSGARRSAMGFVDQLSVGSVEFRDCPVVFVEKLGMSGADGVIGPDIFSRFLVTIDNPKRSLRLAAVMKPRNKGEFVDREVTDANRGFTPVYSIGSHLFLPTRVNSTGPMLFVIDTGAYSNLISEKQARTVSKVRANRDSTIRGASGQVQKTFSVDEAILQFATFEQRHRGMPSFDFSGLSRAFGIEVSGLLGMSALELMSLTIDYTNGMVDMKYTPKVEPVFKRQ